MREDAKTRETDLHYHDGSTCHGSPTLEDCLKHAIRAGWTGKVLRQDDVYPDGRKVSCFTLIVAKFDHWAKHGTFVAVVELTSRLL